MERRQLGQHRNAADQVTIAWLMCLLATPAVAQAGTSLQTRLASADAASVSAALEAVDERANAASIAALAEFIAHGQPDAFTDRALAALGRTRSPRALPVLSAMTQHRRAQAREAAYLAAANIADPQADLLLGRGLRDSSNAVRVVCARALGERALGGHTAAAQIDLLFRAFERGVSEAGPAIGKLADAGQVERLHGFLGRAPIQAMLDAYRALLLRADVNEATKLAIVARLAELATPNVKLFLEELSASHDWSRQLPVLRAMASAAAQIQPLAVPEQRP
jgi:hypothetical protein